MNYTDPKSAKLLQPGAARYPAITTQEIIAGDEVPAPEWVRSESYTFLGDEDIDAARYTTAEYAQAEVERMWPRNSAFAGHKQSGIGTENGQEGLLEFTVPQTIYRPLPV